MPWHKKMEHIYNINLLYILEFWITNGAWLLPQIKWLLMAACGAGRERERAPVVCCLCAWGTLHLGHSHEIICELKMGSRQDCWTIEVVSCRRWSVMISGLHHWFICTAATVAHAKTSQDINTNAKSKFQNIVPWEAAHPGQPQRRGPCRDGAHPGLWHALHWVPQAIYSSHWFSCCTQQAWLACVAVAMKLDRISLPCPWVWAGWVGMGGKSMHLP